MASGRGTLLLTPPGQGWAWWCPQAAVAVPGGRSASPLKLLGSIHFSGDRCPQKSKINSTTEGSTA